MKNNFNGEKQENNWAGFWAIKEHISMDWEAFFAVFILKLEINMVLIGNFFISNNQC